MLIAIDVDQVVVDPSDKWCKYMSDRSGSGSDRRVNYEGRLIDYDLSVYYYMDRRSAFEFWDLSDLYDNLEAIKGSVRAIKDLEESGHEIIFLSKCTDGHQASKLRFLKRFFGEDSVLINSHTKGVADGFIDVIIDDRLEVLNGFNSDTTQALLFGSEFNQTEKAIGCVWYVRDWIDAVYLIDQF